MQLEPIPLDTGLRERASVELPDNSPVDETSAIRALEQIEKERSDEEDLRRQFYLEEEQAIANAIDFDYEAYQKRVEHEEMLSANLERIEIDQSARLAESVNMAERVVIIGNLVIDVLV